MTDESDLRSVTFVIRYPDSSQTQSFSANPGANDIWSVTLQGFSDGNWNWWVEAKDKGSKGGNLAVSNELEFAVDSGSSSGGSGGDSGDTVTNAHWVDGGAVQTAVGRLYFEMPDNPRWKRWSGYVCSGTVAMDNVTSRSVIITAAHCVYDDVNKAFARHVLFIPNQVPVLVRIQTAEMIHWVAGYPALAWWMTIGQSGLFPTTSLGILPSTW